MCRQPSRLAGRSRLEPGGGERRADDSRPRRRREGDRLGGPFVDRRERRTRGRQHRLRSRGNRGHRLRAGCCPQLHAAAVCHSLHHRPRSQAGGDHAGHAESHVPRQQRGGGQRDGNQGRQGVPQAQRRTRSIQDHQQVRVVSRRPGTRAVARLFSRPPKRGLRAGLSGVGVRPSAERVPVRQGRSHAVGVRRALREGRRGAHQVPPAEHGRGGDSRAGDERWHRPPVPSTGRCSARFATSTASCSSPTR